MTCFEDLLNQLVEEGKIEINKDSVVVEFLCGCNRKAARVISKYKPKYNFDALSIGKLVIDKAVGMVRPSSF